jgi:two-component system cell cycle sensor histidine kinase/response regulator CckA
MITAASRDLVTETNSKGRFVYVNAAALEVTGRPPEAMVGTSAVSHLHPDDVAEYLATLRRGREGGDVVHVPAHRIRHENGSWVWVEATGVRYRTPDGEKRIIGVARDVGARIRAEHEHQELERRLRQIQKLEGLGVMAGGIAHDFNNLLTPILGDASLALLDLPEESPQRPALLRIQQAAHRAAALTNQMLTYAGKQEVTIEPLDLSQAVAELAPLLESAASSAVPVRLELEPDIPAVSADRTQLGQIVMNLALNAAEAMGDSGDPITVRTGVVHADRRRLDRSELGGELPEGTYGLLEVSDSGTGMSPEMLSRIFDPFFTTKFTGRGLGLATVLGIVRRHRGTIEIQTGPDEGTRFRVLLPQATGVAPTRSIPQARPAEWRACGTILVVDDDEGVRSLVSETLSRIGIDVVMACNGLEGVALFRSHADAIDGVLLDRTMPGLTGERAFAEIRRIQPDARVVMVSGYSQERAAEHLEEGLIGFLQKPFLPESLVEMVRKLLPEDAVRRAKNR